MLGQLGIGYTWDAKNQTVDVTSNAPSRELNSDAVMKANLFNCLEDLGED